MRLRREQCEPAEGVMAEAFVHPDRIDAGLVGGAGTLQQGGSLPRVPGKADAEAGACHGAAPHTGRYDAPARLAFHTRIAALSATFLRRVRMRPGASALAI